MERLGLAGAAGHGGEATGAAVVSTCLQPQVRPQHFVPLDNPRLGILVLSTSEKSTCQYLRLNREPLSCSFEAREKKNFHIISEYYYHIRPH